MLTDKLFVKRFYLLNVRNRIVWYVKYISLMFFKVILKTENSLNKDLSKPMNLLYLGILILIKSVKTETTKY